MARTKDETWVAGVRLTHPDRVLYPGQGITKRELAAYYEVVAERMLPHVEARPLTLVRCPAGAKTECFFQRRAGRGTPKELGRVEVPVQGKRETYLTADDLPALLAMVQLGVLEMHVWGARRDRLDRPDRMIHDLDPAPGVPWEAVVEGAFRIRDRLRGLGLRSWVKTSGGKGLHVVTPLARRLPWDELREFSRGVAEAVVRDHPERFLTSASREAREGKIYIDYLRNSWSASAVAPYSTRSREGAPVSFPLAWEELGPDTRPADFNVRTVPERVHSGADPWAEMAAARQTITREMMAEVGV
ncbi:MAG: non-homologous end-joining DNA ligase [Gemmatimonadota bacterium]|nr:non-homologous end-joining DNA ligase [Gemmatimonadota bacterium]